MFRSDNIKIYTTDITLSGVVNKQIYKIEKVDFDLREMISLVKKRYVAVLRDLNHVSWMCMHNSVTDEVTNLSFISTYNAKPYFLSILYNSNINEVTFDITELSGSDETPIVDETLITEKIMEHNVSEDSHIDIRENASEMKSKIADKVTLENNLIKFWKSSTESGSDVLLYSLDIFSVISAIADKATLDTNVIKFWKTSGEREDILLFSVDISSIVGAGGATEEQAQQIQTNTNNITVLTGKVADKVTLENKVIKFWKSATESGADVLLYSVDITSVTGATDEQVQQIQDNKDNLTALIAKVADKVTLDGKVIKFWKTDTDGDILLYSVDISSVTGATDEQAQQIEDNKNDIAEINTELNRQFEVIEDTTISSNYSSIERTAKSDGSAYNFKAMVISFIVPALESGSDIMSSLRINGSTNPIVAQISGFGSTSGNRYSAYYVEIKGGRIFAYSKSGASGSGNMASVLASLNGLGENTADAINKITITASRIPSGTRIIIKGM